MLHPLSSCGWTVTVNVQFAGQLRFSFASYSPFFASVLVSAIVCQNKVQEDKVLQVRFQSFNIDFECWKHSPGEKRKCILIYKKNKLLLVSFTSIFFS